MNSLRAISKLLSSRISATRFFVSNFCLMTISSMPIASIMPSVQGWLSSIFLFRSFRSAIIGMLRVRGRSGSAIFFTSLDLGRVDDVLIPFRILENFAVPIVLQPPG
jgi:hypothetical protein